MDSISEIICTQRSRKTRLDGFIWFLRQPDGKLIQQPTTKKEKRKRIIQEHLAEVIIPRSWLQLTWPNFKYSPLQLSADADIVFQLPTINKHKSQMWINQ